jgi:hypothetical protein
MATHPKLGESLDRLDRYEAELAKCDSATRKQLLAAWKEQVLEDCAALLRATDDPRHISNVDRAIALSTDNYEWHRTSKAKT